MTNFLINAIKDSQESILIRGETGTGKSVLAQKIHANSIYKFKPLIMVNISSLNTNLFESELFGTTKGAFTGALEKVGFLEATLDGTLFLDEIGDLDLNLQSKLLQVLENKSFYSLGSTTRKTFKGRFIFATHQNLEELVKNKKFREDLYFRIRNYTVHLPPLREKMVQDPQYLNSYIYENYSKKFQPIELVQHHFEQLNQYDWPGNYRELIGVLDYLFHVGELPWYWKETARSPKRQVQIGEDSYYKAIESFERHFLEEKLKKFQGRINLTARKIRLSKVTLLSRIKKYNLNPKEYNV